jgi:hypothetical protein
MAAKPRPLEKPTASFTFANWQRALQGEPLQLTSEATFFTDTWVTGEVNDMGPYSFINTIANGTLENFLRAAIVMRVEHHHGDQGHKLQFAMENDFDHYHGGDYLDEIAALASLLLGVRLKAGGTNREFRGDADRYGKPVQASGKPDPQLSFARRPQIPRLAVPVNLNSGLEPLRQFPACTVVETNALIKASRQYQEAVWIADADPSLAWLLLVSAIETAAQQWSSDATPIEQLKLAHPELVKSIQESACPGLLVTVADSLKQLTGSTKRFVDFGVQFAPAPPSGRPEGMQFSYASKDMRAALKLIYKHRSKALHGGVAFPMPMCEPPRFLREGQEVVSVQEKPLGLGTYSQNASWKIEQTPMLLNTFEHIVRGALLSWWKSLDTERSTARMQTDIN